MVDAAIIVFNTNSNLITMHDGMEKYSVYKNYNEDIFTTHGTV